jgi:hypothetical protein
MKICLVLVSILICFGATGGYMYKPGTSYDPLLGVSLGVVVAVVIVWFAKGAPVVSGQTRRERCHDIYRRRPCYQHRY